MQRFASLFALFLGLCIPLLAQDAPVTRVGVTARFVPNGGNPVSASIPEVAVGNITVPLQVAPASTLLLTIAPTENDGELSISVADTALIRPPMGTAQTVPAVVVQATYPFTFGRPVTVMQTSTYRIEVLLTRL